MKKLILVTAAAVIAVPATAQAKEISKLEVCGASDCNSTSDRHLLTLIGGGSDGGTSGSTPALQPFYKLTYTITAGPGERFSRGRTSESFSVYYVPGARETSGLDEHGNATWSPASRMFVSALARLSRGLGPLPRPRITGVTVDGRAVSDPQSYARLLTVRGADPGFIDVGDWQAVQFRSAAPSPWTGVAIAMLFSPSTGILARDYRYLELPKAVVGAIRDREALPSGGGSGFPAWGWGLIGLASAVAAALFVLLFLRRPRGGPRSVAEAA